MDTSSRVWTTIVASRRNGAGVLEEIWKATTLPVGHPSFAQRTATHMNEHDDDANHNGDEFEDLQTKLQKAINENTRLRTEAKGTQRAHEEELRRREQEERQREDALRLEGDRTRKEVVQGMQRSHEQEARCLQAKIQKVEETHDQERRRIAAETQAIESKLRQQAQKEQAKLQEDVVRLESQINRLQTDFDMVYEDRQHQKDFRVEAEAHLACLKSELDAANTARVEMEKMCRKAEEEITSMRGKLEEVRTSEVGAEETVLALRKEADAMRAVTQALSSVLLREISERRLWLSQVRALRHGAVSIVTRMRPRTSAEKAAGKSRVTLRQSHRHAPGGGQQFEIIAESENTYTFQARIDRLLGPEDGDDQVWGEIGETICGALLSGQKAAVIANGQTRAGKTTTIQMLVRRTAREVAAFAERSEEAREDKRMVAMSVSMVEDHNDVVYDLLAGNNKREGMKVDQVSGVFASSSPTSSTIAHVEVPWTQRGGSFEDDLMQVVQRGNQARTTRATAKNSASSRSHAVLVLRLVRKAEEDEEDCGGLIAFVDLAGNESLQQRGTGQEKEETLSINKNLQALGRVVQALASKAKHVPFRDSTLTKLLAPVLEQSTCWGVFLLLALSPLEEDLNGTKQTLRMAGELLVGGGTTR